jgi:hypothetical protein
VAKKPLSLKPLSRLRKKLFQLPANVIGNVTVFNLNVGRLCWKCFLLIGMEEKAAVFSRKTVPPD